MFQKRKKKRNTLSWTLELIYTSESTGVTGVAAIYRYISGPCTRSMPWTVCDATTNYTWARGRSRWLGPQEAGSTPLKLELRRPSARKTTRRQYEPPPTPWSRGRGGETRLARGEVAREGERGARKPPLSFTFYFVSRFYFDRLNQLNLVQSQDDRLLSLLNYNSSTHAWAISRGLFGRNTSWHLSPAATYNNVISRGYLISSRSRA